MAPLAFSVSSPLLKVNHSSSIVPSSRCRTPPLRPAAPGTVYMVAPVIPSRSTPEFFTDGTETSVAASARPTSAAELQRTSQVEIYDTTLRDGAQGEGISLSVSDKMKIAQRLDDLGVHYIEGGWPGSNPKDEEFFLNCPPLKHARLVAFGSTRHKSSTDAASDGNVKALLSANTPVVTLVGKTWNMQVSVVLGTTLDENLRMIFDTIDYLKHACKKEVMFDAEHFFDGYESSSDYSMQCLRTAVDAGCDCLVLCDTNGNTLPWKLIQITNIVKEAFPNVKIGIHCHNDMEMAVANSIAAIQAGAHLIQGTVNGYGERTGNANLMSIMPILQLKMQKQVLGDNLKDLTKVSKYVDEIANQPHVTSRPFVGSSSFAHKGGLHVAAVLKNADTYQHIDPEDVGNECRILVSELSGRRNILSKAKELGLLIEDDSNNETKNGVDDSDWSDRSKKVLEQVKELENKGYCFEGAEASLELMLRRSLESYRPPFELLDFFVNTDNKKISSKHFNPNEQLRQSSITMATVKLALLGPKSGDNQETCPTKICLEVAEGNGPVDAVNAALERALFPIYPRLASVSLVDYKVRILDNQSKTKATTRVMVDFKDTSTGRQWTTVYADPNIIVASVNALIDGFEVAMWGTMPQCMV